MSTSYIDVYAAAMTRIIDPDLAGLRKRNIFLYFDKMYNYMLEGIVYYTIPSNMIPYLSDRSEPFENSQLFNYDAEFPENEIILTNDPLPDSNSILTVKFNEENILYEYDENTYTVKLLNPPEESGEIFISWYNVGKFNNDLTQRNISIMGAWTAYVWALAQSNNELDINRLLLDGDFRMASEGSVIPAKANWVNQYREQAERLMTSNDWADSFMYARTDIRSRPRY